MKKSDSNQLSLATVPILGQSPRSDQKSDIQSLIETNPGERIQKALAHAGFGSRREIEDWIRNGLVRINGTTAKLGDRMMGDEMVHLKGKKLNIAKRLNAPTRVLLYHKPSGEVVTRRDPEGRAVIFTQLPKLDIGRWITVGRLDINTQGLLLVTNNGELANRLMHPSQQVEREYAVRVFGKVTEEILKTLQSGVELSDGQAHFDFIDPAGGEGANTWFRVVVKEGRNRVVRRLWESQGIAVSRLMRVRYGEVVLPERLKARRFYELEEKEMAALLEFAGVEPENRQPQRRNRFKRRKFKS